MSEQVGSTPTSSFGEIFLAHMCIRCMAIPTPHIIPIIWPSCKAPDAVLTLTSRFRVRSELEAHQTPPAHDTRTRVAAGFSTTGI